MSSNFVVEAVEEKLPLRLECAPGPVRDVLTTLFGAADFALSETETKPYALILVGGLKIPPEISVDTPIYRVNFSRAGGPSVSGVIELNYEQVFSVATPALSLLDELARRLIFEDKVRVRGGECAPLLLEDACQHVVQTVLSGKRTGGTFVGDKKISFTELMANLRAEMKLSLGKKLKPVRVPLLLGEAVPSRSLKELIERTALFYQSLQKAEGKPVPKKNPAKRKAGLILLLISFLLGVMLAGGYSWYRLAAREVAFRVKALAYEPGTSEVPAETKRAVSQLDFLGGIKDSLLSWAHQGKESDLEVSLPLLRASLDGAGEMYAARIKLMDAFRAFSGQDKGDALARLREADSELENAYKNFSLVQVRLLQREVNLPQVLGGRAMQEQLAAVLPSLRKNILETRSIVGALSTLLDGKHSYAVLLLDDTNLRGSGGVVVGVAVLSVDSGKLLTSQVYPVSVVNQMLTGQVQAPDEVRTYLRSNSWMLPDATWEVPFSKTAEKLSWFLGKELSRPIDGIVTIPASRIASMLEVSGTLSLEGGEELTSDGFKSKRADNVALLGKDPKALEVWYNKVFTALLNKIMHSDGAAVSKFSQGLKKGLGESDVFVNVADPNTQRLFAALSWDGSLNAPSCPEAFLSANCHVSSVMEVENSLGGNNLNHLIQRSHVHAIRVGSDVLLHNRVLTLTNTANLLAWPYGSYQTLVKYVLNDNAQVQSLSLNDQVLTPSQFSLVKTDGKLMVRVGVEVATGATVRLRLLYTEPGIPAEDSSLVFFEQKQAGAGEDPFALIVTYPENYAPKSVAPRAEVGKNSLTFSTKHDSNRLFAIGF